MNEKLRQIFKEMRQIDPPQQLAGLVLKRIKQRKDRKMKRNLFLSYAGFLSSVFASTYAILFWGKSILESEFWSILSLAFSDAHIVAGYWQDYLYSLLETLPAARLILITIPLFGIFISICYYVDLKHKNKNILNHNFKLA